MSYENLNAKPVLEVVENYLRELEEEKERYHCYMKLNIRKHWRELSIFDWWKDGLSISDLKNMHDFLTTAIEMGFTGYVCFKVGASGCANGMWCHKDVSTDGYSPDGDFVYRSFTPDYVEWDACINDEILFAHKTEKKTRTLRNLKKELKNRGVI